MCNFKDIEDEELIKIAQKDIDTYRIDCYWKCEICGNKISYIDSLSLKSSVYVHDIKCPNYIETSNKKFIKCNNKMSLIKPKNYVFNSKSFEELFKRYSNFIENESKYFNIKEDEFNEVYSSLCLIFFKSVALFNRENKFKKTSNKWFKSFFYTAAKNRLVDIRKTNSYVKRTPSVLCACCGKEVGQITYSHLMKEGHDDILNYLKYEIGELAIEESGEKSYYKEENHLRNRIKQIGNMFWDSLTKKEKKNIFKNRALEIYNTLFPNSFFKNSIFSTNETIFEESDVDIEENQVKNINETDCIENDFISNNNIENAISIIYENIYKDKNILEKLDNFYIDNILKNRKEQILKEVIKDRIVYEDLKDYEIDKNFPEIKKGFTSLLFSYIRKNNNCKKEILEKCL